MTDVYAAIPSMTGKIELEYEGELRGADNIARELIRAAVGKVFDRHLEGALLQPVVQWFEMGGELRLEQTTPADEILPQLKRIQGLMDNVDRLGVCIRGDAASVAAAAEFILEGLYAHKRISRNEERGFYAEKPKPVEPRDPAGRSPRRQFN